MLSTTVKQGKDLMLFTTVKGYTSTVTLAPTVDPAYADDHAYVALGFATNHTKSITVETSEITSKDHGLYSDNKASKITWEVTSENLYTDDYITLRDKMLEAEPIYIAFGEPKLSAISSSTVTTPPEGAEVPADDATTIWEIDTAKSYEYGKALITSLEENAANGETATYSITLTGCGRFRTVNH